MKKSSLFELQNFFYRAHPWHGVDLGEGAPHEIHCYIEIVPTDNIKFELDKATGLLKADRPQKYSNFCPSLYGLIPRTYSGKRVGDHCAQRLKRPAIAGDGDPLDICILTEKPIQKGDILVTAIPIGGIRAIDGDEADDKIIAVLKDDLVYEHIRDLKDCPINLIDRLCHYFLTYKESPADLRGHTRRLEIADLYDRKEAHEVIQLGILDYEDLFTSMQSPLSGDGE